jgi:hypothetical protein
MTPMQGGVTSFKTVSASSTDGSQAASSGAGEGLDFAQTLQELSETNPNAAALLLALQQAELSPQTPVLLQTGGRPLPTLVGPGGNELPQLPQQTLQLNSLQQLPMEQMPVVDVRQLQELLGDKVGIDRSQLLAQVARSGLAAEGLQALETRGLGDFGSQLQGLGLQLQSAQLGTTQRAALSLPVQVPVGQAGWDSAVGERIQWMVSRNVQQADIKLTPPELGPMEIKISVQNDQTQVQFVANHAATRDALEASIPRLREMFGEINLNLANVDVNQQQAGDTSAQGGGDDQTQVDESQAVAGEYNSQDPGLTSAARTLARGLLDTYA